MPSGHALWSGGRGIGGAGRGRPAWIVGAQAKRLEGRTRAGESPVADVRPAPDADTQVARDTSNPARIREAHLPRLRTVDHR